MSPISRDVRRWLVRSIGLSALAGAAWAQPVYTYVNVGTLGGSSTYGLGINASGEVTGYSWTAGNASCHAFIYSHGRMRDLGTLGGNSSIGNCINDNGEVTGSSSPRPTPKNGDPNDRGFIYSHGRMRDLGTLGGTACVGKSINNHGDITGNSTLPGDQVRHAFLYTNGRMSDLGAFGATNSEGVAINDAGMIAGNCIADTTAGAFLYADGVAVTFGGNATAMNDWGEVLGSFTVPGEAWPRPFLYSTGRRREIGVVDAAPGFWPLGINRWNQIVGVTRTDGGWRYGFLYSALLQDVAALLDENVFDIFGWDVVSARAINDSGQIVCDAWDGAVNRCLLLTPVRGGAGRETPQQHKNHH